MDLIIDLSKLSLTFNLSNMALITIASVIGLIALLDLGADWFPRKK